MNPSVSTQWRQLILKRKKINFLTNKKHKSYQNAKICYIFEEKFENKYLKDKKYRKGRGHCHYTGKYSGATHSTFNLKYIITKEIHIAFHNRSNHDYHFIIK